jgi:type IV pilus assembly protein PilY1
METAMTRIHPPLAAAPRASWPRRALCLLLAVQLGLPLQSTAATINFAQQPMASTTATVVKPNLMFVLDDSGSMDWDYTPDYVNDSAKCFDSGDDNSSNGSIADSRDTCFVGMPPYMSPDFNKAYYSPEIVYKAGVNADGSSKGDQTNLASVATDPYGRQQT